MPSFSSHSIKNSSDKQSFLPVARVHDDIVVMPSCMVACC